MQPSNNTSGTNSPIVVIDRKELERLIRESVQSEMVAQQARKDTKEAYVQRLNNTDTKVTEFIQLAINETTRTYQLSIDSFFVGYLVAFLIFVIGFSIAIFFTASTKMFTIAVFFIAIGLIWIINIQNKNISKKNRTLLNNLAKLNIIFTGYIRQIHQIDVVFEEFAANGSDLTLEKAEQLLNNLQDVMLEALNAVTTISKEIEE